MGLMKAMFFNLNEAIKIPIPVMFNPPDYTLKRANKFQENEAPGKTMPTLQFINREIEVLNLSLFFDTSETGVDVQLFTQPVLDLSKVDKKTGSPPKLLLVWGTLAFQCFMVSVDQTVKEFSTFGWGVRAEIKVSLKGYNKLDNMMSKVTGHKAARVVGTVVAARELMVRAKEELGDEKKWKVIAVKQKIKNPFGQTKIF